MRLLNFGIGALVLAFCATQLIAQSVDEQNRGASNLSEQKQTESACLQIPMREERTYRFRRLPFVFHCADKPCLRAAAGPPKWYHKLFPFLIKDDRTADDLLIERELGRPIPFGETKRSQKIRADSETKLLELQNNGRQGLAAARLERFDWRENGLDVGKADFQGFKCQTCWAFAAVDAMQISRRLIALRAGRTDFNEGLKPSVQQLVSCMSSDRENYCDVGWHGEAFSFMVNDGLPLGGRTRYEEREIKYWTCNSQTSAKALTWDFVSADPRKVSTKEEIKDAIIKYGSVAAMIHFDKCLWLYGGGTFNGENNGTGSHFVLIIGWDDRKDGGAWLVKNSFGNDWGERGFGWIKYGSNNIGESSAWVMADPREEERIARKFAAK
jgi:hypothetical protein